MAAMLLSALSVDAFMLSGSAVTTRARTTAPAMDIRDEAAAKNAWFRKNQLSLGSRGGFIYKAAMQTYTAPIEPSGPMPYGVVNNPAATHGVEGAVHTTAEILQKVRRKAEKAKKAEYGGLVEMCSERTSTGW